MLLPQLKFGRVLNGDDALVVRNIGRENVQKCGLAGPGAAGNDKIYPPDDAGSQKFGYLFVQAAKTDQVLFGKGILGEFSDSDRRPGQGQRRDDSVDPGAVGQTGID